MEPTLAITRHEDHTRICHAIPVTLAEMDAAGIELADDASEPLRLVFGVRLEPDGTVSDILAVEEQAGAHWRYALPVFGNRYFSGSKGRIATAANQALLEAFLVSRVPNWQALIAPDREALMLAAAGS